MPIVDSESIRQCVRLGLASVFMDRFYWHKIFYRHKIITKNWRFYKRLGLKQKKRAIKPPNFRSYLENIKREV